MKRWQLQEAKNRLSELVRLATSEGPQAITVRGDEVAVIVSARDYDRLALPRHTFVEVLLDPEIRGILSDIEADELFARTPDYGRAAPDFGE